MGDPLVLLFTCYKGGGFHPDGPYTAYLVMPGMEMYEKTDKLEHWKPTGTYGFRKSEDCFIFLEDPPEALETGIIGNFPNAEIVRLPHLCVHCRKKGARGAPQPARLE